MQLLDSCPLPQAQFASLSILLQIHLHNNGGKDDGDGVNAGSEGDVPAANKDDDVDDDLVENVSSDDIEPTAIQTVEAQTASDGAERAPPYAKGATVYYKDSATNAQTRAVILGVHLDDSLEPYYTIRLAGDGREKQTDGAHLRGADGDECDNEGQGGEGDNQRDGFDPDAYSLAGDDHVDNHASDTSTEEDSGAAELPKPRPPRHAVLEESLTVVSPLTLLPEAACRRSMDGLRLAMMEEFGMVDDFRGIGGPLANDDATAEEDGTDREDASRNGQEEETGKEEANDRRVARVTFQEDTKQGAAQNAVSVTSNAATANGPNPTAEVPFGALPVRTYQPPAHHLNCSLGLTVFYLAVPVEDVSRLAEEGDTARRGALANEEQDAQRALRHCAAVLLPGVRLPSAADADQGPAEATAGGPPRRRKRGGVVLLAVGTTGPAYDLFGASSVIAALPDRLREGAAALARVDVIPGDAGDVAAAAAPPSKRGAGPGRAGEAGREGGDGAASGAVRPPSPRRDAYRDAAYFRRLYAALLASLLDDEDGLLRDADEAAAAAGKQSAPLTTDQTESTAGLLAGQSITSSGTFRKKRFTFSRKRKDGSKRKNDVGMRAYASGEPLLGGEEQGVSDGVTPADATTEADSAEIVRRASQLLELMSLAEDDMDLPRYSHAANGTANGLRRGMPHSPMAARSPRRAPVFSGRFGRPSVPSDLAGFEYRPPIRPQHYPGGGSSVSGTASTVGIYADDASVRMAADDSATVTSRCTAGSHSSIVPILSKSKRDKKCLSSRSRFLQRKKEKNGGGKETMVATAGSSGNTRSHKPPLFQQRSQSPYDPFSMDEAKEDDYQEGRKPIDWHEESEGARGMISLSAKESAIALAQSPIITSDPTGGLEQGNLAPISPIQQVSDRPPPQGAIGTARSRSYSEESDGAVTECSTSSIAAESAASITTENAAEESEPAAKEEMHVVAGEEASDVISAQSLSKMRRLDVGLALNEDLMCEYKQSKLSSLKVEGTVQVRVKVKTHSEDKRAAPPPQSPPLPLPPFILVFKDRAGHIKALQENKKFVKSASSRYEGGENLAKSCQFSYTIEVPEEEEYFPVVRYKCSSSLRPVPIRVQSRIRIQGRSARIALQISSNPQNSSDLTNLTIIMSVPHGVEGDTLQCNPPGGVWDESKRAVLWCISELGAGEKFQLQSIFEIEEEMLLSKEGTEEDLVNRLEFPVLLRCQCSGAQLSNVALEVSQNSELFPAEVTKTTVRRFRVSHMESNV